MGHRTAQAHRGWVSLTDLCDPRKGVVVPVKKIGVAGETTDEWVVGPMAPGATFSWGWPCFIFAEFSDLPSLWSDACHALPLTIRAMGRGAVGPVWWSIAFYLLSGWGSCKQCPNSQKSACESNEAKLRGGVGFQNQRRQRQQKLMRGHFQVPGAANPEIISEQKQGWLTQPAKPFPAAAGCRAQHNDPHDPLTKCVSSQWHT